MLPCVVSILRRDQAEVRIFLEYQHEIRTLDARFPYPELTLERVGIPPWEVLPVKTRGETRYVELTDERSYSAYLDQNRHA